MFAEHRSKTEKRVGRAAASESDSIVLSFSVTHVRVVEATGTVEVFVFVTWLAWCLAWLIDWSRKRVIEALSDLTIVCVLVMLRNGEGSGMPNLDKG